MVRSEMISFPNRGWMARPAHLPTLLLSLLPLWQEYWQQRPCTLNWTGTLALQVGDEMSFLEFGPTSVDFVSNPSSSPHHVALSEQAFIQLIFGFRPLALAMTQLGQQIPVELMPVLNVLFPLRQAWIAGSDFF
jgi:hypothetical protein